MKSRSLGYLAAALGIVLTAVGLWLAKTFPEAAGAMAALPYVLIGLGCAPIYPSIIHSTPEHFGTSRSQAMIGLEMASAYVGSLLGPPAFGLIANHISPALLPGYLLCALAVMVIAHRAAAGCAR